MLAELFWAFQHACVGILLQVKPHRAIYSAQVLFVLFSPCYRCNSCSYEKYEKRNTKEKGKFLILSKQHFCTYHRARCCRDFPLVWVSPSVSCFIGVNFKQHHMLEPDMCQHNLTMCLLTSCIRFTILLIQVCPVLFMQWGWLSCCLVIKYGVFTQQHLSYMDVICSLRLWHKTQQLSEATHLC